MDMNYRGGMWEEGVGRMEWSWGGDGTTVIAESINIFFKKRNISAHLTSLERA